MRLSNKVQRCILWVAFWVHIGFCVHWVSILMEAGFSGMAGALAVFLLITPVQWPVMHLNDKLKKVAF